MNAFTGPSGSKPRLVDASSKVLLVPILLLGASCQTQPAAVAPPPPAPVHAPPASPPSQSAAATDARPSSTTDGAAAGGEGGIVHIADPKPAIVGAGSPGEAQVPQGPAPSAMNEWADTLMYRVKVDSLVACRPKRAAAPSADGEAPRETVGAFVHVSARVGEFAVNPRDFVLQRGGLIVQADLPTKQAVPGCGPALGMTRLMALKQTQGYVVFDLPPSFKEEADKPVVLSFRPTRWGGAPRVNVTVPACLASCPPPLRAGKGAAAGGGAGTKRPAASAVRPTSGGGGETAQ